MKTAPFNLELALAGHPLVTRNHQKVTNFKLCNLESYPGEYPYTAIIKEYDYESGKLRNRELSFTENGSWLNDNEITKNDLFMLIEE